MPQMQNLDKIAIWKGTLDALKIIDTTETWEETNKMKKYVGATPVTISKIKDPLVK